VSKTGSLRLRPKKSLGQNFLRDENIARKIVAAVSPQQSDVVLEIGPGEGALTKHLTQKSHRLIVVDIDRRATERMRELYSDDEVVILTQDFLELDLVAISGERGQRLRIVGNIPYNITSPILFHVLDHREAVVDATFMMQREVARRLVAVPDTKDYGILAVFCQVFADVELLFDVSPNAFYPKPKVTSSLVQLTMRVNPRHTIIDEEFFRRMIRSVFGKRRKTLRNSLAYFGKEEKMAIPTALIAGDLQRRPENLTIEELVHLSNALKTNQTNPGSSS